MTAAVQEQTEGYLLCHFHALGCERTFRFWTSDLRTGAVVERDEHAGSCDFRPRGRHRIKSIGSFGGPLR